MGKCERSSSHFLVCIRCRLVTRAVNLVKQFGFVLVVAVMIVVFWDAVVM